MQCNGNALMKDDGNRITDNDHSRVKRQSIEKDYRMADGDVTGNADGGD